MDGLARRALDREREARPGIGGAWILPAPKDPSNPLGYHVVKNWLVRAEKLAKLPHLKGGMWHPYRRGWATARKHLPTSDVAKVGGWRDEETLRRSYQRADASTILRVVEGG